MAIKHTHSRTSYRTEINRTNKIVARRFGVTVTIYKIIKQLVQLVGVLGLVYAMFLGAEPFIVAICIVALISGPELMEYFITLEDSMEESNAD